MKMEIAGTITFGGHVLNVYESLDEPLFSAVEVARLIDYSVGSTNKMLLVVEEDEKVLRNVDVTGRIFRPDVPLTLQGADTCSHARKTQTTWFVTELGLYNILSQSRKPIARGWRRIVHQELIDLRKSRSLNVIQQFDAWDDILDTLFIDPDTGVLMQSVTVAGGDVEQIPYVKEEE